MNRYGYDGEKWTGNVPKRAAASLAQVQERQKGDATRVAAMMHTLQTMASKRAGKEVILHPMIKHLCVQLVIDERALAKQHGGRYRLSDATLLAAYDVAHKQHLKAPEMYRDDHAKRPYDERLARAVRGEVVGLGSKDHLLRTVGDAKEDAKEDAEEDRQLPLQAFLPKIS
jgi:hypothetical protein